MFGKGHKNEIVRPQFMRDMVLSAVSLAKIHDLGGFCGVNRFDSNGESCGSTPTNLYRGAFGAGLSGF